MYKSQFIHIFLFFREEIDENNVLDIYENSKKMILLFILKSLFSDIAINQKKNYCNAREKKK